MHRQPAKRSSLFLLELIIAILFFCLASAVCIRFFVRSHIMEQEITARDQAVSQSASVAELIRSGADLSPTLEALYPDAVSDDADGYSVYYDADWNPCDPAAASYILRLDYREDDGFADGQITVSDAGQTETIYTLAVKKYLAKEESRQ